MDRLIKITLLIIGLSVAFIWMSNSFSSCKSDTSQKDALTDYSDKDADELFEGEEIDYSTSDVNDAPIEEQIVDDELINESANTEVDFTEAPTQAKSKATTQTRPGGSLSGNYMVIAGNYLVRSNAENMMGKLEELGYRNVSIVVFDNSQYHTVIAERYSTYEKASETSNALKRQGVESYVKKKQ